MTGRLARVPSTIAAHSKLTHHQQVAWFSQIGKRTDEYTNETAPRYYDLLAQYYSDVPGPYLLGSKITYADFAIYQSIDNDRHIGALPVGIHIYNTNSSTSDMFYLGNTTRIY